jgi:DNA modification methylase
LATTGCFVVIAAAPEDLDRLLDGAPIHLVHTDPPYGVAVEPRSNGAIAAGLSSFSTDSQTKHHKLRAKDRPIANDEVTGEAFDRLLDAWFANVARVLVPGGSFYVWGGYANLINYPPALKRAGLYFSQAIVWDKLHPVISRKDYMGSFELAYYGWREGAGHTFYGPNNATDLWHLKKLSHAEMLHLTAKPVELAVRALQYSSLTGQNVLDLFGGSGMTLMAAEQTKRHAYLMELDALYCDVIVRRWEEFTGRKGRRYDASGNDMSETTPAAMAGVVGGEE